MSRIGRRTISIFGISALMLVLSAGAADAHPLGNFTVNLYSGLSVTPAQILISYVVDMAEIPTFQETPNIDTDGDGAASAKERDLWARTMAPKLLANLDLEVGGRPVELSVRSAAMWFRPGQGGLPILRFEGTFVGASTVRGEIAYRDGNYPDRIGWREITAAGADGERLVGSSVPERSVSDTLRSYPVDMLSSPLRVTSMSATARPGQSADVAPSLGIDPGFGSRPRVDTTGFVGLVRDRGFGLLLAAFFLAMAFGAWHALLPGHGKTLMAAYMVGSETKTRQAIFAGSAVALMHTASVLGLGLLVLTLQETFRPEALYPWLGLVSGLVAMALGGSLATARIRAWRRAAAAHAELGHTHPLGANHDHPQGGDHAHGEDHGHVHGIPEGVRLNSRRGLMALALAGGILPSPSAVLVMLAAIAAHRVVYGLGLIMAFSFGLGAALIAVSLGALRARAAMANRLSSFWGRLVPVLSASAMIGVGVFLAVRGALQI